MTQNIIELNVNKSSLGLCENLSRECVEWNELEEKCYAVVIEDMNKRSFISNVFIDQWSAATAWVYETSNSVLDTVWVVDQYNTVLNWWRQY